MRLLGLDLLRFGPFTDRRLNLREDARLHVIYGPNETGKTCAHEAVRNLLFGFPHSTTRDFLHKASELRIGGEVLGGGGQRLSFVRRKGNRQTLLDPDGRPLAEDALAPFLGNVTEAVFCLAFGLDAEGLRKGAMDLLASDGEAGSSLMAAASGLRGLSELRKTLDEEAAKIFTPRARLSRRYNEIHDRLKAAQDALRGHELRADAWKRLNGDLATLEAELSANAQLRGEASARRARLDRLKRLAPIVRRIDAEEAALTALGTLPDVPAEVPAALTAALSDVAAAVRQAEADGEALFEARRQVDLIAVDAAVLDQAARIDDLLRRSGACAKEEADLPRVRAEADQFTADLTRQARALGLDIAELLEAPPTEQAMARLRKLAADAAVLEQRLTQAREALRKEQDVLASGAGSRDPRQLQERFGPIRSLAAMIEQERKLAREIERDERALADDAARLYPPVDDLALLAQAPLPGDATLSRFRDSFDEIARRVARLRDEREATVALERDATRRLDELAAGGGVPTAERIAQAREARDVLFSALRPVLTGDAPSPAAPAEVLRYELAVSEADRLADAAAQDANRVAEYAASDRACIQARERQQVLARALDEQHAAKQLLATEWTNLWAPITPAPVPPAEMQLWLVAVRALLARHTTLIERRADLDLQRREMARVLPLLQDLQRDCDVPAELGASEALRAIEMRLQDLAAAWEAARAAKLRIARHEGDLATLEEALEHWTADWREALPALRLMPSSTREEALAALDVWKLVPAIVAERDNRTRRVQGMQRNVEAFAEDACALVVEIAADLAAAGAHDAVNRLSQRLTQARQQHVRQAEASKRLAACDAAVQKSVARRLKAEADLSALLQRIGSDMEPAVLADLFGRQRSHLDTLGGLRAMLDEADGTHGESTVRAELSSFDPDAAEAEKIALDTRLAELDRAGQELFARAEELRRKLRDAEGRTSAELANQQKQNAEAELQQAAHDWAVLKIAGVLLDGALKHHRAGRQDPLMQRAGSLFAMLTGGAYAGIEQDYGEDDGVRLVARRQGGASVNVDGLSEGTRDQFYLALRLAYVEDYASRAEAAPFLADDLFASFDERRTEHGLRVLAEIGAHVQPILFTHHRHVVDLAQAALANAVDVVELA